MKIYEQWKDDPDNKVEVTFDRLMEWMEKYYKQEGIPEMMELIESGKIKTLRGMFSNMYFVME